MTTIEDELLDRLALLHAPLNVSIPIVALRRHWSSTDSDLTLAVDTLVKKGLLVMSDDLVGLSPLGYAIISKQQTVPPPFAIRRTPRAA